MSSSEGNSRRLVLRVSILAMLTGFALFLKAQPAFATACQEIFRTYYSDASCTVEVGEWNTRCEPPAEHWGVETPYFWVFGGECCSSACSQQGSCNTGQFGTCS